MTNIRRKLIAAFATVGLVSLLSGCIKLDMDVKVSKDEKISGTVIVGLQASVLELMGQTKAEFLKEMKTAKDIPKGAKAKPYDKGGFVGQEISFTNLPASEFGSVAGAAKGVTAAAGGSSETSDTSAESDASSPDDIKLEKVNGKWVMTGTMNLSDKAESDSSDGSFSVSGMGDLMKSAKIRIKMTFPGKIIEHDKWGKVKGNTIEWNPKAGQKVVMRAVANAS
jgi:hypothetical protein